MKTKPFIITFVIDLDAAEEPVKNGIRLWEYPREDWINLLAALFEVSCDEVFDKEHSTQISMRQPYLAWTRVEDAITLQRPLSDWETT